MLTNQNLFDTMEPSKGIFAEWCNGSTADSDSVCEGSNPSPAAIKESLELQGFEGSFLLLF